MLPALHRLFHQARWEFRDHSGVGVAALEERPHEKMAFVGVQCHESVTLSAPVAGVAGFARVSMCTGEGTCKSEAGVEATRRFLAAMHNRSRGVVIVHNGYIVGRFAC